MDKIEVCEKIKKGTRKITVIFEHCLVSLG